MGSTYLTLVNKALRRVNEVELTSSNFSGATGFHALIKDSINDAIRFINQEEFQWPFNYTSGSQVLTGAPSPVQIYSLPSTFKDVDWDTFYLKKDTTLKVLGKHLRFITYDEWVQRYKTMDEDIIANAATLSSSIPQFVFKTPNQEFGVTPAPLAAYTITFDYWAADNDLSASSDTTKIPTRFDSVIIDGAMEQAYLFRDNFELARNARNNFLRGIKNMRTQLINTYDHVYDLRTGSFLRTF